MNEIYPDSELRRILSTTRRIAMIGVSVNQVRPSFYVARYLALKKYDIIAVNPVYAGQELFGQKVVASLADIAGPVDMVDIFRRSEHVPPIIEAAQERLDGLKTIWMQIGVYHQGAAEKARAQGVEVIMNRCPKMEHQRLFGELRRAGINTGIISSRLD